MESYRYVPKIKNNNLTAVTKWTKYTPSLPHESVMIYLAVLHRSTCRHNGILLFYANNPIDGIFTYIVYGWFSMLDQCFGTCLPFFPTYPSPIVKWKSPPRDPQIYWHSPAGTCGKWIISPLPIGFMGRTVYLPTWMECRVAYIQISHNLRTMVNGSLPAGHPSRVYRGWNPTQLCGDYFTKKL